MSDTPADELLTAIAGIQSGTSTAAHSVSSNKPWSQLARHWSLLGPPLRPCQEDMQRLQTAWEESLPEGTPGRPLDILALGVTPEVATFAWAPLFSLTAIDSSVEMVRAVWPGDGPHRRAIVGDWLQTPFADASFDLVITDGGLVAFSDLNDLGAWSGELRRIVRANGRAVVRHFARPAGPQQPAALVEDVATGKIRDFNELKLRLLLALPSDRPSGGVSLPGALDAFNRLFPDRTALAAQLGCAPEVVATIDAYRGRDTSYNFASLEEIAHYCPEFSVVIGPAGHYPLADCCPVLAFTPAL